MITEYHFPTPVYIQEIPNAGELNYHLEKQILQWQKDDPKGVSKTNAGGWQSHRGDKRILQKPLVPRIAWGSYSVTHPG